MNLKCTKRYVDKHTKQMIEVGTQLKNIPEGRAKELLAAGVVQEVKETKKNNKEQ